VAGCSCDASHSGDPLYSSGECGVLRGAELLSYNEHRFALS
jgi:hypothetical protein